MKNTNVRTNSKELNVVGFKKDEGCGIQFMFGNIFDSKTADYILIPSSVRGLMSNGFSLDVKNHSSKIYSEYREFVSGVSERECLKGKYLILDDGNLEVAKLFCIYPFAGKYNYFDPVAFENSFDKFIEFATKCGKEYVNLSVPIQYKGLISQENNDIILNILYRVAIRNPLVNLEVWIDYQNNKYLH